MHDTYMDFVSEHPDIQISINRHGDLKDRIKLTMCDYLSPVRTRREICISTLELVKDKETWLSCMLNDMYMEIKDWRAQHGNS